MTDIPGVEPGAAVSAVRLISACALDTIPAIATNAVNFKKK
jgi:hypothetical protein